MKQLTEETFPYIKPPFVLSDENRTDESREWIMKQEASGNQPPRTRRGTVCKVAGTGDQRVVILDYHGIYVYVFNQELPDGIKDKSDEELMNEKIPFKLIKLHEDKLIGSYNAIAEYYRTAMNHGKIMTGKVSEIRKGKTKYGEYAILVSKGDRIIIPTGEFAIPSFFKPEERIGHIVDFIVVDVKGDKFVGSTRIVTEYRQEQLDYFRDTGETFKAEVEKVGKFGASLTYKHNNALILRNKDFSDNFTFCSEVLEKGDTVNVKIRDVSPKSHIYMVEMVNKYHVEPNIKYEEVEKGQSFEGMVVGVEAFGCFVRIGPERDVLCAVNTNRREPVIGDKVTVEIISVNPENRKIRGDITKYNDEKLDLSKYNLLKEVKV